MADAIVVEEMTFDTAANLPTVEWMNVLSPVLRLRGEPPMATYALRSFLAASVPLAT